jgi:hypothetical protein
LKSSIRTYIFHLRELIENSADLDETKRRSLLDRLSEFEAELDKKRLNLVAIAALMIAFIGAPGAVWASADAAGKILSGIVRLVADAKRSEDATRRLPSIEPPMAITGPRRDLPRSQPKQSDMDDEIPF